MSARIRSIKNKVTNNKNTKIFSKTSSNFMKSLEKSPKLNKEFCVTKSTRFSNNNITETIASSIRTISKFKSRKKGKPIFINLDNFHKIYNGINTNLQIIKSLKKSVIKLKKKQPHLLFVFLQTK